MDQITNDKVLHRFRYNRTLWRKAQDGRTHIENRIQGLLKSILQRKIGKIRERKRPSPEGFERTGTELCQMKIVLELYTLGVLPKLARFRELLKFLIKSWAIPPALANNILMCNLRPALNMGLRVGNHCSMILKI